MLRYSVLLATAAFVAGCDNPVTPGHPHEEPAGVAVFAGGVEIARSLDGEITGALPTVGVGEQSGLLTVVFLDEHGDGLDLTGEEDVYLRVSVADGTKAAWQGTGYTGRLVGVAAGTTTLQFDLMHGEPPSGGHPDFRSLPFPVTVDP